jgi:glycosyltransferase EpsF
VAGGGVEAVIMNYYEHIDRSKIQFDFVVHRDSPVDITGKVESMGGKVYKVTPYTKNIYSFMYDIYKIIRKNKYQIIHSNMNTLSVFSLFPAWLAGAKIRILHNHSTSVPSEIRRNIMKIILRPIAKLFANQYIACSKVAAEWMYGKRDVCNGKVIIIYNAIDLNKYAFNKECREKIRKELRLENKFVIGHVGRFMYQKNHKFLIDVFFNIVKKKTNAELLLIGNGLLKKRIEEKCKNLHIEKKVQFLGLRDNVQDLYNAMDIFILPSYYEGLGMVGIEAQANGLHVIGSSNVPYEMKCSELVYFENLHMGANFWAKTILKFLDSEKINRCDVRENLIKSGYDIYIASMDLERLYMKLNRKVMK